MRYRKLTAGGDRIFGHQQADFWVNTPEGVAQAVKTRLQLQLGDWFLDTSDGTDWKTKVLGNRTALTRDGEVRTRAQLTSGVNSVNDYSSSFNPSTRAWSASFTVDTIYGPFRKITASYVVPSSAPRTDLPSRATNVSTQQINFNSVNVSWTGQ